MSTTDGVAEGVARARRARLGRRVFLVALVVFVGLGLANVWGVRAETARAEDQRAGLAVEYPRVARPGLAVPFQITVDQRGGFDGPVSIAVDADYFELFDQNGIHPAPSEATRGDERIVWEFDAPTDATTFEVSFDVRIGPSRQWGEDGLVRLLDAAGGPVLEVDFYTWILP